MKSMFFDWQWRRLGYASGSHYKLVRVEDQSEWLLIGFGLYWRTKEGR